MKLKLIFEVIRGNFYRSASSSFVHNWLSRGVEEELEGVREELEEHNWGVEEELEGVEEEQRKSAGDEEKKSLEERSSVEQTHDEGEQTILVCFQPKLQVLLTRTKLSKAPLICLNLAQTSPMIITLLIKRPNAFYQRPRLQTTKRPPRTQVRRHNLRGEYAVHNIMICMC